MSHIGNIAKGTARVIHVIRDMRDATAREKRRLVSEMGQVRGLMPLLMKPRNQQKWSGEDKALLAQHIKRLSAMSPYLMMLVMPGGFLALPVLAWWLDRRRLRVRAPSMNA